MNRALLERIPKSYRPDFFYGSRCNQTFKRIKWLLALESLHPQQRLFLSHVYDYYSRNQCLTLKQVSEVKSLYECLLQTQQLRLI